MWSYIELYKTSYPIIRIAPVHFFILDNPEEEKKKLRSLEETDMNEVSVRSLDNPSIPVASALVHN